MALDLATMGSLSLLVLLKQSGPYFLVSGKCCFLLTAYIEEYSEHTGNNFIYTQNNNTDNTARYTGLIYETQT